MVLFQAHRIEKNSFTFYRFSDRFFSTQFKRMDSINSFNITSRSKFLCGMVSYQYAYQIKSLFERKTLRIAGCFARNQFILHSVFNLTKSLHSSRKNENEIVVEFHDMESVFGEYNCLPFA